MNIDERLEALAQTVELMAAMQKHAFEEAEERELRFQEKWLEMGERQAEAAARFDREMMELRGQLGRAVRASILEARQERRRRHELDERLTEENRIYSQWIRETDARLTKRHEELQELLKAFLDRGGNGKH